MKTIVKAIIVIAVIVMAVMLYPQSSAAPEAPALPEESAVEESLEVSMDLDSLGDDVVAVGGHLKADGVVKGDVVCVGGTFDVDAKIEGELVLIGSTGKIGPNTVVEQEFVMVGSRAEIDSAAVFKGERTNIQINGIGDLVRLIAKGNKSGDWTLEKNLFEISDIFGMLAAFLVMFGIAIATVAVVKQHKRVESTILESPLFIFLMGLLAEVLFVPAIIILAVSIVGIPFIPLFILAVLAGLLFGWATVVNYCGKWIAEKLWKRDLGMFLNVLIGMAAFSIIPLIHNILNWTNVSYLNTLFGFLSFLQNYVIITFALGGVMMSRFGTVVFQKNSAERRESALKEENKTE